MRRSLVSFAEAHPSEFRGFTTGKGSRTNTKSCSVSWWQAKIQHVSIPACARLLLGMHLRQKVTDSLVTSRRLSCVVATCRDAKIRLIFVRNVELASKCPLKSNLFI